MEVLLTDMVCVLRADMALPSCLTLTREDNCAVTCLTAFSSSTLAAAATSSFLWLALSYTEEVVGEALARPVMGSHAVRRQKAGASPLLLELHRQVHVCGVRNAEASVTA